jgi:hypothetical protein
MQNYNAGVGERYYMLFNVSNVTGLNEAYVMFTVSQYDSYSYLFYQPTFISLDPTVKPNSIPVKGIRIGINGTIPQVGQAYIPLNTTITSAGYTAQGEVLSTVGTVIGLQSGPLTDQFFLTFDQLGSHTNVVVEPTPTAPPFAPGPVVADIGVRTFAEVNATLSQLTGVPTSNTAVNGTYLAVQQQLPADPTLEGFSSSNQIGVAQLAIQYCNAVVNTPSLQPAVFGSTLSPTQFKTPAGINSVTGALAARVLGSGLNSQPSAATLTGPYTPPTGSTLGTGELTNLIGQLCSDNDCGSSAGTNAVAAAACATAFGSADMLIK